MVEIRTKRLLLRPMRAQDRDDLFAVYSHPEAMRYWSTLPHETPEVTEQMIAQSLQSDPATHLELAIDFQGRVIGKVGLWQIPEIGYILHPDHWGQGLASEAVKALMAYAFDDMGLARITADVDPNNAASQRMLKKLGFSVTGHEENTIEIGGKWFDSVYLECPRPDPKCSDNSV